MLRCLSFVLTALLWRDFAEEKQIALVHEVPGNRTWERAISDLPRAAITTWLLAA